jgi:sensor histidine kinase YesM
MITTQTVWNYLKEQRMIFLFSLLGGGLLPLATCRSCSHSLPLYATVATFTVSIWISMWLGIEGISNWLDKTISWTRTPLLRTLVGLLATCVYTIAMVLLLKVIIEKISGVYMGNALGVLSSALVITLLITFFMTSRSFLLNWRETTIAAERLKKESIAAQYESLKTQVNPHFLFNSFNVLSNLVYEDQDKAVKFIRKLSEVYRYVLDSRTKEVVNISDELDFLKSWVFLQQMRFGEKLKIDMSLDNLDSQVAPLALQMLFENAIKHNIVSEEDPLTIRAFREDGFIVVENNLQVKTVVAEESSGLGLENITKRYEFLSPTKVQVQNTGSHFIVKLPIIHA